MTTPWFLWETSRGVLTEWAESLRLSHRALRITCWAPVPGGAELEAVTWYGADAPPVARVPISGHALGWVVREGVSLRAEARDVFRGLGAGWLVAVPVVDPEGVVLGALSAEVADAPEPESVRSLEFAAAAAGRMLFDSTAYRLASEDLRKDQMLHRALEALELQLDLDALARSACDAARTACAADGALTALWERREGAGAGGAGDAEGEGRIVAVSGNLPQEWVGRTFRGEDSHLGLALRTATPLPREQARVWGDLPAFVAEPARAVGSFIVAPMLERDLAIGALAVAYDRERGFHDADIRRLEILARFVGPGLRNVSEYATLSAEAKVDALTGLANRRGLEERLRGETVAAQQGHAQLSVILVDLDHFKQVNDRWGHEAGDAALRAVAGLVEESIRPGDAAGRWGGEEIVVVLPGSSLRVATEVAERIRQSVERAEVYWNGRPIELRVSAGVSTYPDSVPRAEQLLAAADAALYFAKRNGRNAVAHAEGTRDFVLSSRA